METDMGIKVLLQDQNTRLFYADPESWTADPTQAFDFQLSAGLPRYSELLCNADTALVVHFFRSRQTEAFSLRPTYR